MSIIYTTHAKQRMRQRKVTPEEVIDTLESPDEIVLGDYGEEIAVRRFFNREVRVVYQEADDDVLVVYTVMQQKV
jgi:hypothetical protein